MTNRSHIVSPIERPTAHTEDDDALVFRAIGDPARRQLMDALFVNDGQSVNELCEVLPEMTRFGVMKHLKILVEADLIITEKVGRSKLHYLNPVPIQVIHDRWISKFAAPTTAALTELARRVNNPDNKGTTN